MAADLAELEDRLDSVQFGTRRGALLSLCEHVQNGRVSLPAAGDDVNLHCHTFFSYNAYGYSPTKLAWLARRAGIGVAGIVDFDVLDGLAEFVNAGRQVGLKACVGMETRVFLPEFADSVVNSPGEPGICYHLGVGFPSGDLGPAEADFLSKLRQTAAERNRAVMRRTNEYLMPVTASYERDVVSLTPSGNATERHICLSYVLSARAMFEDDGELEQFWREKVNATERELASHDSVELQSLIRAVTMKQGGPGYVEPETGSFPRMDDTNRFIAAVGGIPAYAWLDGTSPGECELERLLAVVMDIGVEAMNIIPDRNYTPGIRDEQLENLRRAVGLANELHLPVVVGTEMNSPGQKFVDDFGSEELAPMLPVFLKGAHIVYAHSVLQTFGGLGYGGEWARKHFPLRAARNEFYARVGATLGPAPEEALRGLDETANPDAVLRRAAA